MLPPSQPEQRSQFYEDIESLINPGFLSHRVTVCSVNISLRSLMPSDLFLLQHRVGHKASDRSWKTWCVATCVWMVDGQYLLADMQAPVVAFRFLKKFPDRSLDVLFYLVVGLQNRVHRATEGVEAYCYEDDSRTTWSHCGRQSPVQESFVGLPDVHKLGSNHIQRIWMSYNQFEDERLSEQMRWNRAKMVASSHAPKGVEKLDKKDQQRWRQEEERRQKVMDTFYYKRLGVLKENPPSTPEEQLMALQVAGPKSTEELAEEMRKWVAGERDLHDRVVQEYKDQIIQRQIEEQQKREEYLLLLQRESQMRQEGDGVFELVGYTSEQLQVLLKKKTPVRPGIKTLYDNMEGKRRHVTEKYLMGDVTSGVLSADQDGLEVGEAQIPDLNSQIAGRRVSLGPEEG